MLPPSLLQPYQDQPLHEQRVEKILAHFSPEEIEMLISMMPEGPLFDPETNLLDLSPLEGVLDNPEVKAAISQVLQSQIPQMAEGGHIEERPIAPELEELRSLGRNGDTELAIITPRLAEKFIEWNGGQESINPETGLLEFFGGFFKSILRVVAPVVGAVLGGPLGAAGASVITSKLMGDKWGDALKQGAISGVSAFAAPAIGNAFSSAFPNASSAIGNAANNTLGSSVAGGLGNIFGGSGAGNAAGTVAGNLASQSAAQGVTQGTTQAASNGILTKLADPWVLGGSALIAALLIKGHEEDKKNQQLYEDKNEQDLAQARKVYGMDAPWKPVKPYEYIPNPVSQPQADYQLGKGYQHFLNKLGIYEYAAKGGRIVGPGTSTSDSIPSAVPAGTYIMDAATVKRIGKGKPQKGFEILDKFSKKIPEMPQHPTKCEMINVMLSNGEYEIPPEKVSALGKGSNRLGAQKLDKFRKNLKSKPRSKQNLKKGLLSSLCHVA